jgi:hypothetical protein
VKKLVNTIFITSFVTLGVSFVNAESYDGYDSSNPADNCYTERCDPYSEYQDPYSEYQDPYSEYQDPYSEYQDPYSESYIPSCELTGSC